MSARALVAIRLPDGSIKGMIKRIDVVPSITMPVLELFGTDDLAEELVQFENCSQICTKETWDGYSKEFKTSFKQYLTKLSNQCYIFDGTGEPQVFKNEKECFNNEIVYLYIWNKGKWSVVEPE